MTNRTDTWSKGDLVLLWDDIFDGSRGESFDGWGGYYMMPPVRMRLHGKIGIVLSRKEVPDDIYESQTYWVLIDDKKELVNKKYMRKVEE